jgi:hypothetical protein
VGHGAPPSLTEVWEPLLKELRVLETDGVEILVDGEPFRFKAFLVAQIGDTLAAHEVLGFASPSSKFFCRSCYVKREDMWADGTCIGEPRTHERHAQDVEAVSRRPSMQKKTGVKGPSKLDGLRFFRSLENSIFDIFHDLNQGICKMEVKLALREYVCVKKYITISELNSRLQFFDYGFPDKKNKPSAIMTTEYLNKLDSYNLHVTGAQMWLLVRCFGFLFGDKVPADDKFMQLITLLNQIMAICFAHAMCEEDLVHLDQLILEHHRLFAEIFPGENQPAEMQLDQEYEEALVEEEGLCEEDGADEVDEDVLAQENFQDIQGGESDNEIDIDTEETDGGNIEEAGSSRNDARKKRKKPRVIRFINKHHHLLHYVELIRKYGPLILYWAMRYEARHYFFKLVATVCNNFINILKTLMEMLQMKICADREKQQHPLLMGKRGKKCYTVCDAPYRSQLCAAGIEPLSKVYEVKHVTYRGIDYRPELFVTLQTRKTGQHPIFARIQVIYVPENQDSVYLLIQEWRTIRFESRYCAYHVAPLDAAPVVLKKPGDFPTHRLLAIWKRYDSDNAYLAPRTIA